MKNVLHEIHRRSLWQVLGIYLAGSWVALQVVEQLTEAAGLPEWVRPFSLVLLILGFPIVMATAFVQQGVGDRAPLASPPQGGPPPPRGSSPGPGAEETSPAPAIPATKPSVAHGILTWRNAIFGGVGAFALLGLLAAGWLATRALGVGPAATLVAQGVIGEKEPIVLADFASAGGDASLGEAVTEALRIELGSSPVVQVVEGTAVTGALRRMQRDPADGLDREVALELAVREGYPAVIAGEVRELASGYQLSAAILQASDGTSLAGFRETARDADGLIDAIDRLSKNLRQKVGESIRSVRGSEPLDEVSTASLEALRRYSEGVRAFDLNDFDRSRALLEEAVAVDSGFAMAYRKLGAVYQNLRRNQALVDAMSAAYRHRERLTRTERLHVEAAYHLFVAGDRAAAIRAFEELLELDPDDGGAANNLAVALGGSDPERAIELYRGVKDRGVPSVITYTNLAGPLMDLGRYDEALEVLEEGEQRFPDAAAIGTSYIDVYSSAGRLPEARSAVAAVEEGFRGTWEAEVGAPWWKIALDGLQGHLASARRTSEALIPKARAAGSAQDLVTIALMPAYQRLVAAGDVQGAVVIAEAVLARDPLDAAPPSDRQTLQFADFFVRAGDAARARALLDKWRVDRIAGEPEPFRFSEIRALADFAAGDVEGAIAALEGLATPGPDQCLHCVWFDLGWIRDRSGDHDGAIADYQRYVDADASRAVFPGHWALPHALERLGQLYDARADEESGSSASDAGVSAEDLRRAADAYRRFVDLWADADEELQPRVRAAQERLEQIVRERG